MAASTPVKVALTQMACGEDPKANMARQLSLVERAMKKGAKIVCTQELFRSQYFCQVEDHRFFALAESIPGPSTDAFAKLAKKYKAVIVASLFEKRAAGVYHNTAAVIDADGSLMGVYRKMHIPDDPLFYEKFYFTPGDTGFRSWKTKHATIGVLICWDQWFPEGARLTAMQGAEILFYPTAIGWHPSEKKQYGKAQHDSWELIQRSHAVANGCYVCAPNRIGHEVIKSKDGQAGRQGRPGVLGPVVCRLARRPGRRARAGRQGNRRDRRLRPRAGRVQPHALAVPARPPDRRLRRPHQALRRLAADYALDPDGDQKRVSAALHGHTRRTTASSFPPEWHPPFRAPGSAGRGPKGISFPDRYHEAIENIAGVIRAITPRERVHINVPNDNYERLVRQFLRAPARAARRASTFITSRPTNAGPAITGPAFVLRKRRGRTEAAVVDWGYNAWGGKYPPYDADDAVPTRVAEALGLPVFYPRIVMEGGAVDFNGAGTVLTTTSCLLNKNRNPNLSKRQIERYLRDYYGQRHVVWLGQGIEGDDTDGHIDDLARFIDAAHHCDRHRVGSIATRTSGSCKTTARASPRRAIRTASRSASSICRCRNRSSTTASACRRPI